MATASQPGKDKIGGAASTACEQKGAPRSWGGFGESTLLKTIKVLLLPIGSPVGIDDLFLCPLRLGLPSFLFFDVPCWLRCLVVQRCGSGF